MALLNTLYLIRCIGNGRKSAADLSQELSVSDRTLKRLIGDAKDLGAELVSERDGSRHVWVCRNWEAIAERGNLTRWIELEEERQV